MGQTHAGVSHVDGRGTPRTRDTDARSDRRRASRMWNAAARSLEPHWARYGCAVVTVLAITGVRFLLAPLLHERAPLLLFTLAVAVTARLAGFFPGLVAAGLSATIGAFYFFPSAGRVLVPTTAEAANVAVFLGEAALLSWLGTALRRASITLAAHARTRERIIDVTDVALRRITAADLVETILDRLREAFGADVAALFWMTADGRAVELTGSRGLASVPERLRVPLGHSIVGRIASEAAPIASHDLEVSQLVAESMQQFRQGLHGFVGVPLKIGTHVRGVVTLATRTPRTFGAAEIALLQLMAERLALVIENARLIESERTARMDAESASRAKDEFVATVSHELRTPLNVMQGWLWRLQQPGVDEATRSAGLQVVERNLHVQIRLVEDLLDMSRAITGKLRMARIPVRLGTIVDRAADVVRPDAAERGITLTLQTEPDVDLVLGDPDRLQQVVWNLLSNGVKFTPEGGRVDARIRRQGVHVVLTVTDTGVGIAPEFLPQVFERFRQEDASSTREHGGLGIGLAIVRQLVELHGGAVSASSEGSGRGSTFQVALPVPPVVPSTTAVSAPALAPSDLTGIRVLVVEDRQDAAEMVALVLQQFGAKVKVAASSAEALAMLEDERTDVIIADLHMPGADGLQMIEHIRARGPLQGVPAAALTALSAEEHQRRALSAGYQVYLTKPVAPPELAAAVKRLVSENGSLRLH